VPSELTALRRDSQLLCEPDISAAAESSVGRRGGQGRACILGIRGSFTGGHECSTGVIPWMM
jgi:hypothetical protein